MIEILPTSDCTRARPRRDGSDRRQYVEIEIAASPGPRERTVKDAQARRNRVKRSSSRSSKGALEVVKFQTPGLFNIVSWRLVAGDWGLDSNAFAMRTHTVRFAFAVRSWLGPALLRAALCLLRFFTKPRDLGVAAFVAPAVLFEMKEFVEDGFHSVLFLATHSPQELADTLRVVAKGRFVNVIEVQQSPVSAILQDREVRRVAGIIAEMVLVVIH